MGLAHPKKIRRNRDARAGDVLVLGKPLGVGVMSAALKKEKLDDAGYARLIDTTTKLNTPGIALAELDDVHAITDVTGFGIAGHTLELARGAGLRAVLEWPRIPLLPNVMSLAEQGFITGASRRNWEGYGSEVELAAGLPELAQPLVTDPQTSGGLLVSCAPDAVDKVLAVFREQGFTEATVVGRMEAGEPGLTVTP